MTLRTSPRFASGWERVGPTRSANHTPPGAKLPRRDASSAGRSADPLLAGSSARVLLQGSSVRQPLLAEGRIIWLFLVGWYLPILLLLEGKGKGSHAYDSMAIRRLRPFSHAQILAPHARIFGASGEAHRAGYLVFGLLSAGVSVIGLLAGGGVLHDGVEHLRGVVRAGCDGRFGGASGDGLSGCIS